MNLRDITREWLVAHGYDGLWNDSDCGCHVDDLMLCGEPGVGCEPGFKRCDESGEYDFLIGPKKEDHSC